MSTPAFNIISSVNTNTPEAIEVPTSDRSLTVKETLSDKPDSITGLRSVRNDNEDQTANLFMGAPFYHEPYTENYAANGTGSPYWTWPRNPYAP